MLKKCGKFMTMEFLATLAVALLYKMQWENAKRTAYKVLESAAVYTLFCGDGGSVVKAVKVDLL